jgi:hypothetical protein
VKGTTQLFNRRTVITFEKLERNFYRLPDAEPFLSRCYQCGADVSWLTPNQALAVSGLTLREIFRRTEASILHFKETRSGLLFICPNSLVLRDEERRLELD